MSHQKTLSEVLFFACKKGGYFVKSLNFLFIVLAIFAGNIFAQDVPGIPNGSISKNGRDDYDNGIRIRSMELERVKGEIYRSDIAQRAAENRKINYLQIKKDFELIQTLENAIVKTYVTGKKINYNRISELASKLNECAKRLDENLSLTDEKEVKKPNKKDANLSDVKEIIVLLDKSIGNFVANPLFKNLYVFEAKDNIKAEFDLQNIINLSEILKQNSKLQ